MQAPSQVLVGLKERGRVVYIGACLAIILVICLPLTMGSSPLRVSNDEGPMLWLAFGFLVPIFQTWLFQDLLQEALLRREVSEGRRVVYSWGAVMLVQAFVSPALLLASAVQNFFYSASYAVWRRDTRKTAFLVALTLHLLTNNTLLMLSLWMAPAPP